MYNNDPSNYLWMIGVAILVVVLLLDTDWKRRLFETYPEKLKRSEKFRNKELKRRLRNTPWLIPGNKSWHEMHKDKQDS